VWVELDEESDGCLVPYAVRPYASVGAVRYTPAKPAKLCRWSMQPATPDLPAPLWDTGCGHDGARSWEYVYCGYCGGKIKVKR